MAFLEPLLAPVLVGALFLGPLILLLSLLHFWKRFVRNRNRRSPLTSDLLRTPGFGLQDRIEELTHDISGAAMAITWVPLTFFAIYQFQPGNKFTAVLFVITAVGIMIHQTVMVIRRADKRQKYREALAGELATAQLLEPIVAYGGRLLHDIQATGFNIDHVVVAPGGIFAIETKHRLKSTKGKAMEQARVTFDGRALHFPSWVETKPVDQARAQASWLSERLTKATGLSVRARPVIALPGWFVEQNAPSDVVATNPKAFRFMLKPRNGEARLSTETIKRIAYQVEQLCHMPNPGDGPQNTSAQKPSQQKGG